MNASGTHVKAVDNTTATKPAAHADAEGSARRGKAILLAGFLGFFAWAAFAPLDEGVSVPSAVRVLGSTKTIQHPYGGVIDQILVKEGQTVEEGQVLVKLNLTKAQSEQEASRTQWITLRAVEARLLAELSGSASIRYPAWFREHAQDERVRDATDLQNRLLQARLSSVNSELAAMNESAAALRSSLKNLEDSTREKQRQAASSREQLSGLREMEKQGFLARNRLLDAERADAGISAALSDDAANAARVNGQLAELNMRIAQRRFEYQRDVQAQLTDVQRQAEEVQNHLNALNFDVGQATLKSPVAGFVSGLSVHTEGGVVSPGQVLMNIVPKAGAMEVEGQLPIHLANKIAPGMPVDIMFTALKSHQTPIVTGVVNSVSADRLVDAATGAPYFLVKINTTPEGLAKLGQQKITPGMPAEAFIRTGERTFLNYLVKPLTDRWRNSFTEQ